jgi:hypothetical protein
MILSDYEKKKYKIIGGMDASTYGISNCQY